MMEVNGQQHTPPKVFSEKEATALLGRTQSQFRCAGGEKSHAHAHGKN
jgi:hypothetical protein